MAKNRVKIIEKAAKKEGYEVIGSKIFDNETFVYLKKKDNGKKE